MLRKPVLAVFAVVLGIALVELFSKHYITPEQSVLADTLCKGNSGHCYAVRKEISPSDTEFSAISGDIERPDPQIPTPTGEQDWSALAVWLSNTAGTCWVETGIIKGADSPFGSTPVLYSYCQGCATNGSPEYEEIGSPGYSNRFRMIKTASGVDTETWKWQLCPGGGCTHGSDTGWVDQRTLDFLSSCQLRRAQAGGEAAGSSLTVMGVGGIRNLFRTQVGGCGGAGQPACQAAWVPGQGQFFLKTKVGSVERFGTFWTNNILQVVSTCHIDGSGCPPGS